MGKSNGDVASRMNDLYTTGVPLPFECHFAAEVADASTLERKLHQLFSEARVNPKREFFRIEPERVVLAISIAPHTPIQVTEPELDADDQVALNSMRQRRSNLRIEALDIPVGAVLTFSRDETMDVTVLPGNRVEFEGENLSLSAAAVKALQRIGLRTTSAQGGAYWMYGGETLEARRQRLEAVQFDDGEDRA
nr:GIY-YIG nuclease family protein [Acidimicrobium ferrooxidans]